MNLVIDASVALKWLVAEGDSAAALLVRAEHDIVAPDLLLIECRNALLSKARRRELSRAEAHAAESELDAFGIVIVPSPPLLRHAFAMALDLGEPIYDCIYLAAAIATDRTLVTADERFVAAAANSSTGRGRITLLSALQS